MGLEVCVSCECEAGVGCGGLTCISSEAWEGLGGG